MTASGRALWWCFRAVGVSVDDVRACGVVLGCVSVRAWGVRECFRGVFQCCVTASGRVLLVYCGRCASVL